MGHGDEINLKSKLKISNMRCITIQKPVYDISYWEDKLGNTGKW